jgi:glycosyltransferase involved in cell wall biosynthesis
MNYLRTLLWKIALKKIFAVTCPTKKTCDYLKSIKIVDSKKIKLLYDPIIDIEEDKKKLFLKKNFYKKNFFFTAGRLTAQKNFLFLCGVFKDYIKNNPNEKLIIAGDGEDKNIIKKYIKDNSLEKNIFLIGYVKNIFPLIKKAKAFILSSLWEDPGFVIIEAAFCKTLVISSNCLNGPKELIKHKHNGILFKSNNKKSLLKELSNFPEYIKIKKNIIKNNFKISKNFSTNNHFLKLNLILRGL